MSRLNFRHLGHFSTVARIGDLTREAQQQHVSRSALSVQIRQLEQRRGQQLFAREGRRPEEYGGLRQLHQNVYTITPPKRFQPPLLRELRTRSESEVLRARGD